MHLESLARQGDPAAQFELANQPALPELGAYLLSHFLALAETRNSTGMGPARLTRHDIRAWEADEGVRLERWERRAILAIDAAWFRIANIAAQAALKPKGGAT